MASFYLQIHPVTFSASVRLPGFLQSLPSTKSLFKVSQPFKLRLFVCNTQQTPNTGRHSKLQTKCLQSSRRKFKMADSQKPLCVCVCVCGNGRVFSVDWDVGSIPMTDPCRRQIKTPLLRKQAEAARLHQHSPRPPSPSDASWLRNSLELFQNCYFFYLKIILRIQRCLINFVSIFSLFWNWRFINFHLWCLCCLFGLQSK